MRFKVVPLAFSTIVLAFGLSIFIEWPHRFTGHPTHHGPNGTETRVRRIKFTAARWSGESWGYNFWLYFQSRTYVAGFSCKTVSR
jgi:hypothetical protein